jgi:hypothetical protein
VWEDEFVHDCPFSIVKTIQLETIGRALMNRKVNKYFELLEKITTVNPRYGAHGLKQKF